MPAPYRTRFVIGALLALTLAGVAPLRADTLIATQTYTTPGATTYTLPTGTARVVVKVWGAGGYGDGGAFGSHASNGGPAGFVTATYNATGGTTLNIRVGAAPGGASGVWVSSGFQVIGAGGGSAGVPDDGAEASAGPGGAGGATGGSGGSGEDGAGGTTSSGGAGGTGGENGDLSGSAGTGPLNLGSYAANGGAGHANGGGNGGSGYYGGGGGAPRGDNGSSGGGGGGSNYMDTGNGYVASSGTNTTGGTDDPHYSSSLRYGQGGSAFYTMGDGAIVILAYAANQPPVASFSATPATGRAPLSVSFNGTGSSDPGTGGGITAYAWDFDNNGTTDATGSTTSNTFQNTGTTLLTPTVKLTVTDNDTSAATGNTTQTINVYPASSKALTVQSGSITSAVHPYYQPSTAVSISANTPTASALFVQWIVVSGNGTFASATSSSTTFTIGSADTTIKATYGPTVPGSFASSGSTATSISLSWTASADDTAVTGYNVYRVKGGVTLLATTLASSATSFSDTHVLPGTSYGYFLKALDGDGNLSNATSTVTVTTPPLADADSDGLPDAFETLFGTTANANPSGEANHNLNVHRPQP